MNTKRLWIFAAVFGVLAATALYLTLNSKQDVQEGTINAADQALSAAGEEGAEATADKKQENPFIITKGKRAMSVAVDDVTGVSGFVIPGAYVDIVWVGAGVESGETGQTGEPDLSAQLLLQNIKVLAVGVPPVANTEENDRNFSYQTATLEVSPKDGVALALAAETGKVWMMLRAEDDSVIVQQRILITHEQLSKGMIPK